jgi:hypothetical protein
MSDEQCFNNGKAAYRGHDLLAYPLFIGNSFDHIDTMLSLPSKSRIGEEIKK